MVKQFVRDESGVVMGLAVIMIVLIGVMGAGLLVFVRNDLEAVVEVNQGQRALERADVGVEAAKKHLATVDATTQNYNDNPLDGDSEWSEITGVGDGEKRLDFDGNGQIDRFVKIKYLTPSATESQAIQPDHAPEVLPPTATDGNGDGYPDYPNSANFFRVTVRGEAGNAARQVQAIYRSQNFDIPVAFFATRDINFNGNATTVDGISLFARRCITNVRPGNITGQDLAYGDWNTDPVTGMHEIDNPNNVPRTNADGSTNDRAGAAALGVPSSDPIPSGCGDKSGITYAPTSTDNGQKNGTGIPQRYGLRDVDRESILPNVPNSKNFSTSNSSSRTATFPFETGNVTEDNNTIAALKQKALDQGHYIRRAGGETFNIDDGTGAEDYPRDSDLGTVMFIEFAGGTVDSPVYGAKGIVNYRANSPSSDNLVKGTIVVANGDMNTSS